MKYSSFRSLLYLLLLINTTAFSQSIINTLPGYLGTLPFKLETGYIGVGENDEVQLFYYFIQSESDPQRDPLILWLTGGPGCSGFSGLVYEIGPLAFDLEAFDGSFPYLIINPYSWTKIANIIFIDSPVGTGFSYANTSQAYNNSDTRSAQHNYSFLRKWLLNHPQFLKNRLYIAGDSYGGKIVPMVALEIAKVMKLDSSHECYSKRSILRHGYQDNNVEELKQGYIVGNSITNINEDHNQEVPYAHRMALISDEYFELANKSCHGEYVNPDPANIQCIYALQLVHECMSPINYYHILEPKCNFKSPRPDVSWSAQLFLEDDPVDLLSLSKPEQLQCRFNNYVTSYVWANNEAVQEALHIRKGIITEWKRCNATLSYEQDVETVLEHHRLLNEKGFQALAYSGDHDMIIPYMSTLKWIRQLNLTLDEDWRPWAVDGQVAGYTMKYKKNLAELTFATVKGAGHTAPEYKPQQCFAMIKRWLSSYPL